jgi:hypothetical protein
MANIVTASVTDKVATLVLDDASGLVVGEHVHVYGTGNPHIDGHHNLSSVDLGTDTVTYPTGGPDVAAFNPVGAILVAQVTWIDEDDAQEYLGEITDPDELTFLGTCVEAANDWCYHRRNTAGYVDNPTVVPNSAARLGVIQYAASLFLQRGTLDGFQSFEAMPTPAPAGQMAQIMRLLGINRARIG